MSDDDRLAELAEFARGIPGPLDHRRQLDDATMCALAAHPRPAPPRALVPPIPPAELEQIRERIRGQIAVAHRPLIDDDTRAALLAGELGPAATDLRAFFEQLGRAWQRIMIDARRMMDTLAEQLAPALRRLAELAAEIGVVEYQCREERRQHRRNPPRTTLVRRAYRARRRGRW